MSGVTNQDVLRELADAHGVATRYTASDGEEIIVTEDTLLTTLRALGVTLSDAPDAEELAAVLAAHREAESVRPLPASVVAVSGDARTFNVHVHHGAPADVRIILEDGSTREARQEENWNPPVTVDGQEWGEATFRLPDDLPLGWHTIELHSGETRHECALIITPDRLSTTDVFVNEPATGVMAQMYSVRSRNSWGIGDFHDMGLLAEVLAKEAGADFLLVNPMHAAEPFPPAEDSPYLPTTRRFINPIYLRIEDIPELSQLDEATRADVLELGEELSEINRTSGYIERNPIYQAKLDVLHEMHSRGRTPEREAEFRAYIEREGQGLVDFAAWCAQREIEQIHAPRAHAIIPPINDLINFYMWLQFLCAAIVLAFLTGRLSWDVFRQSVLETLSTSASLFIIGVGAVMLTKFLGLSGVAGMIGAAVQGSELGYVEIMLIIVVIYLLLGMFMEPLPTLLIVVPIVIGPLRGLGFDPIWLGVILAVVLEMGITMPPFGLNLFVVQGTAAQSGYPVSYPDVVRGALPYIAADGVALAIIMAIPAAALWLPGYLG